MTRDVETVDLVLAVTLRLKGYSLDQITKDGGRGTFYFSDVSEDDLNDYNLGRAVVEPQAFNAGVKALMAALRRLP